MNKALLLRIVFVTAVALCGPAHAEDDYPAKTIRIVVPVAPGAGTDFLARLIAEKFQTKWSQPVIVENRTGGAAGNVGAEVAFRSAPDGYTLMVSGPGPLSINKALYPKLAYDPDAFVPVSLIAAIPNVLVVKPSLPITNVKELIAYAKANPGKLNYASGGSGTTPHLSVELLKSMTGVDIVHIPYKGSAAAMQGILGGQADLMFVELSSTLSHLKAGRLRAIAIGTEARSSLLPDVPTMGESFPSFVSMTWYGMAAPPKTSPAIAAKLSAAIAEMLKQPEIANRLQSMSIDAIGSTPAEMTRYAKAETERWGKVIRATGAAVD
jgi:tripartite-type tricarboxylate transporter receptor subunit TctC